MKVAKVVGIVLIGLVLIAGFTRVSLGESLGLIQDALIEDKEVSLERIVVTPYRTAISTKENPSATNIINVAKEESLGKFSLVDVIKGSQGVDYAVAGGMEGVSSVFIRGANSYHTQLMLDGVRVYDPTNTQGYFASYNYLSLDNLDKIEISKGPFSSLYGSQSIGGSINMISHKGKGKPTFSFLQEFGSYNSYREKIASQGELGKLSYSLGVSRLDIRSFHSAKYKNGNHERDPFGNTNTALRLDYEITDNLEIGISHRYSYAKYDYDMSWPSIADDFDNTARFHHNIGSIYISNKINDYLSHKFLYGVVDIQRRGWEGNNDYWYRGKSNQFKYEINYEPANYYNAKIGYEYLGDKSEFYDWGKEPKNRSNSKGFFFQNILRPIDNLFLSFVVREEHHSIFKDNITYGLSSSYFIELTKTKLKASFGTGFRAPSLYELFSVFYGCRDLKPEKSKSFDLGFEQSLFSDKITLGSTGFRNRIKNRIDSDPFTYIYYNAGELAIYGVENFIEYKFNDKASLKFTYDYLHAKNKSDKSRLARRPNNKAGLIFNAIWDKFTIAPEIYYAGNRIDGSYKLKSYLLVNLGLNYKANDNLELFGRVENILNYDYQLVRGYETSKASVYAGVKLSF